MENQNRPALDAIFDCLSSQRRRFILYYLQGRTVASVDELAREIAAYEDGGAPAGVSPDDCERVAMDLVHAQLPKLADEQYLEYDRRSETVRYTEPPALLVEILQLLAQREGNPTA